MGSFGNFVGGLIVGAAVGVAVVMFTTPKTGDQTRADLVSFWNNALDTGKQVARQREEELWSEFNSRVAGEPVAGGTTV
ncbi:MAG TPA: YtxH domain-containing protein [Herpetosiphonaceae bacterium]|nr:YtxH domain-containing protein [Herpetosiphonaceae bacterium]